MQAVSHTLSRLWNRDEDGKLQWRPAMSPNKFSIENLLSWNTTVVAVVSSTPAYRGGSSTVVQLEFSGKFSIENLLDAIAAAFRKLYGIVD